jgi:hypothetical protein
LKNIITRNISNGYVVLGPYRSGTSLTSATASKLGIHFGPSEEMFSGTKYNPNGYYEREDINESNGLIINSAGYSLSDPGDPEHILRKCDRQIADRLHFDWMQQKVPWGIKDPRMCATLWTWINLGLIDRTRLGIIHVKRSLDSATASGIKDPLIPRYCDNTEEGVRNMISKYIELAEWHVRKLNVRTFTLQYEDLINNPQVTINRLAQFINVDSAKRIKAATKLVGKKEALRRYYLHRLFVRAPRKLVRILSGSK